MHHPRHPTIHHPRPPLTLLQSLDSTNSIPVSINSQYIILCVIHYHHGPSVSRLALQTLFHLFRLRLCQNTKILYIRHHNLHHHNLIWYIWNLIQITNIHRNLCLQLLYRISMVISCIYPPSNGLNNI